MSLAGEYNVLNATAAAALAAGEGIELAAIQRALSTFKSVKRRLEVRAVVNKSLSLTTSHTIRRPSRRP